MQAHTLDTQAAPNKWWALRDRQQRNHANSTHYTLEQRTRAGRMQLALELCYTGRVYEPSYGTTGVSVKTVGHVRDRKALASLEAVWEAQGIIKRVTAQGTSYRFKK
jgi:hypothetical protein